ncbi:MAG TPA: NAD-dependent epimerase/dehydratase family protein [Sandaracinaceae bacterium LLY-WYZ-13_1]|nr:NAD-dependent epimerase/dehydratase family protein [Sandaracinaceae bacterium LLY-WYZ-13_1]
MNARARDPRPVVAVAGATGFVGKRLLAALNGAYRVIGLTRSPTRAAQEDPHVEWRHCDLFSMSEVEAALEGVDYAIYLVHSMLPNARLTQASFVDLDVLLADNFARAAEHQGVEQILYLGGIRPDDARVSRHLASRLEVERVLAGRATPTTALRAGIVVGPGGSSLRVLVNLVRRLPLMVLPSWTESKSAPIAIEDVVRAVQRCLGDPDAYDQAFEIGGPEAMSYREMMQRTADELGVRRVMIPTPVFSPRLSARWVATVARVPPELVGPLIESLEHTVLPETNWLNDWLQATGTRSFEDALRASIDEDGRPLDNPRQRLVKSDVPKIRESRTVRSVQRLPLPDGADGAWAMDEYLRWLPRFMWPFIVVAVSGANVEFRLRFLGTLLLRLVHDYRASRLDRQLLMITGGVLADVRDRLRGRLEFREVLGGEALIAAIHDFRPTLPWYLYNLSQALVHLWVMTSFRRHLRRLAQLPLADGARPLLPRRATARPPPPSADAREPTPDRAAVSARRAQTEGRGEEGTEDSRVGDGHAPEACDVGRGSAPSPAPLTEGESNRAASGECSMAAGPSHPATNPSPSAPPGPPRRSRAGSR